MSDHSKTRQRPGYLLLRDGHAVPLCGISPDDIKTGAKHRIPNPEADPIKHRQCLTAIVDRLGFSGDFGTFQQKSWPEFQGFLKRHGCTRRVGVFPVDHGGCIDLYFGELGGPCPRQLADRIFNGQGAIPERVFVGYGVNWSAWDSGNGIDAPSAAILSLGVDVETASRLAHDLFRRRLDLAGQWGFIDDKLVHGPVQNVIDKTYWPPGSDVDEQMTHRKRVAAAVMAFRAVFDRHPDGWVDVLPCNNRLVVLRTCDGGWDLVWRNYREEEPPKPFHVGSTAEFAAEDMPSSLLTASDRRRAIHLRQEAWEEKEAHEAEQAFYDRGGSILERQFKSDAEVLLAWLDEQEKLPALASARWDGGLPRGFSVVELDGRKLAVSEMIDVGSFRRMLGETGYGERRPQCDEQWERANERASDEMPVGASWFDAQAFCAWKEQDTGVKLRLPTRDELRLLRPAFSPHYEGLAAGDFPWENYPPRPISNTNGTENRRDVPSAVVWSEPRFLEPRHDLPEFPTDSGVATKSRKQWIKDFPPTATWKSSMHLVKHHGLGFIDAWDACEWCQEKGWVSGRFWEGPVGARSWGAYKNMKVTFRLVIDLGE